MTISLIIDPGTDRAGPRPDQRHLAGRASGRARRGRVSPSSTSGPLIAYNG
jgi:hypothetical protein